jgi:hypothetical protein
MGLHLMSMRLIGMHLVGVDLMSVDLRCGFYRLVSYGCARELLNDLCAKLPSPELALEIAPLIHSGYNQSSAVLSPLFQRKSSVTTR